MPLAIFQTLVLVSTTAIILFTTRLILILPYNRTPRRRTTLTSNDDANKQHEKAHLLIVLGSGGHTAEMLAMLANLDTAAYSQRTYVVSEGDPISATKAAAFEMALCSGITKRPDGVQASSQNGTAVAAAAAAAAAEELVSAQYGSFVIRTVPRARRVHQSLLTAPWTCLLCLVACIRLLLYHHDPSARRTSKIATAVAASTAPNLILTNGPATSAIVIFASLVLRFFGMLGHTDTRIVYVESFARVSSLSLSAKCVFWAVDRLLVQWQDLHGKAWGRAEYAGLLALANLLPAQQMI